MRLAVLAVAAFTGLGAIAPVRALAQEAPAARPRLTKKPKLVKFVEAIYPESERAAGRAASVKVDLALSETGAVSDARVVESAGPAFDAAALAAVRQFVFEPAEIDDQPAPVKITYRYDFVLKAAPAGPVVNFEGVVRDRFTMRPMPGITVNVAGAGDKITDANGHFAFTDVAPGKHAVTLSGPGLTTVSTEENVEVGKKVDVKYTVEKQEAAAPGEDAADLEVVVVAPKIKKEVVSTEIKTEEGRRVPGTGGDTLRVVQNLPGVARAAAGSGALVVWGAAPQDTRVYVDGVRIPLLYHGGGLRATINSDMVRGIELAPGGYGVEYGGGIGGLVTVETRALRGDGIHGYAAVDVFDASALIEAPLDPKTRFAVAARKGYLDRLAAAVTRKDIGELFPIPDYFDAQARVVRELRPNETIEAMVLGSLDSLTRSVPSDDPTLVKSETTGYDFGRVALKYRYQMSDGSSVFATPWVGRDVQTASTSFGGAPATLAVHSNWLGLRAGWRGKLLDNLVATAGVDVEASFSSLWRRGAVTTPPREGDIHVFGQPGPTQTNGDDWRATIAGVAPYAQVDWALWGDRVHLVPGLRVEPFVVAGSRLTPISGETPSIGYTREETAVEPRFAARVQATKWLGLKAAYGMYHQPPQAQDLSAVFGNPTLGVASAHQMLAGVRTDATDTLSIEAVGFFSYSRTLTSRSASPVPLLARALESEGRGRAYGGQILVRQSPYKGFFGWASYSLIRSERQDHPDGGWRAFDFDQTHVLTVVGSYQPGLGFEIGARVRFATGYPRTPVLGAFYDAQRDLYEPYFGLQNSIRIPAFFQADVRVAKKFEWSRAKLEVYLDVQNVANVKNAEDIIYSHDYKSQGRINGLPILPNLGARVDW